MNTNNENKSLYQVFKELYFTNINPDIEHIDDVLYDQALENMTDCMFSLLTSHVLNSDNTINPNYKNTIPNGCILDEIIKTDEWEEIYEKFVSQLEEKKNEKDLTSFTYYFAYVTCEAILYY